MNKNSNGANEAAEQAKTQIIKPAQFEFPKGFKLSTVKEVWVDGNEKERAAKAAKESDEAAKAFGIRRAKHSVTLNFDLSNVNLDDFVKAACTKTTSLVVYAQRLVREKFKNGGDKALEDAPMTEKTITVDVAAALEIKRKSDPVKKAARELDKVDSLEDLQALQKALEARMAALQQQA